MAIYITRKMLTDFASEESRAEPFSVFRDLADSLARRRQRRRAIAELEAMDDASLRDIGIYRGDIRWVVEGLSDVDLGLDSPRAPAQHRSVVSPDQTRQHTSVA
ncbi:MULTISPECIES: DUF1127 domain-containing protein [Sulfitobacter]|uniref:DUF1127 domain-containing protein n=1 Tax=Sulfitobacter profundi TaxID=2679961 RepID=A0ABW1Z2E8_9RHOB|nr:DUF1127 domain-containing protein [Sulfitobacter indolifex]